MESVMRFRLRLRSDLLQNILKEALKSLCVPKTLNSGVLVVKAAKEGV